MIVVCFLYYFLIFFIFFHSLVGCDPPGPFFPFCVIGAQGVIYQWFSCLSSCAVTLSINKLNKLNLSAEETRSSSPVVTLRSWCVGMGCAAGGGFG